MTALAGRVGRQFGRRRAVVADINLRDPRTTRRNLAAGDLDVIDILLHLTEMRCQLLDPLIQPRDILQHRFHFGLDHAGGLMHARIAQDCPHRVQDQHQIVRPGHVDAPTPAFVDKLGKLQIDLGIDGFRWQKHDRAVRGLAGDDVALGDVGDMFLHICLHRPARRCPVSLATGGGQRTIGFQWKFGIDADRARRCRHV